jgi:predicted glycosyltransferase involved in capsule biosynthesis
MTTEIIQKITDKLFSDNLLDQEFDSDSYIQLVTLDAPEDMDNLVGGYEDEFKECLIKSADCNIFANSAVVRDESEGVEFEFSDDTINIYFHCKRVGLWE